MSNGQSRRWRVTSSRHSITTITTLASSRACEPSVGELAQPSLLHVWPVLEKTVHDLVVEFPCCVAWSSAANATRNWRGQTIQRRVYRLEPRVKQLDDGWPESITSQARSAQRCRMRSFSLHEAFVKQARDSTRQGALRKLVGASWSAQVALRKLHCASCSAQVAPLKLLRQVGPCKRLPASCSVQVALPASCSVQAALCKLLCASCSA